MYKGCTAASIARLVRTTDHSQRIRPATYLTWSVIFEIALALMLLLLRSNSIAIVKVLTARAVCFLLTICAPACVALDFAAGRLTVQPYRQGIHRMKAYGRCSQALLFPWHQIAPMLAYFRERVENADTLVEQYPNEYNSVRLALSPSVFQYVGSRSSKWSDEKAAKEAVDENGQMSTERIWIGNLRDGETKTSYQDRRILK